MRKETEPTLRLDFLYSESPADRHAAIYTPIISHLCTVMGDQVIIPSH